MSCPLFLLPEFSPRAMNYNRGARSCRNRRAGDVSDPSNARILRGECFCRKVAYEVADRFEYALNCHCSNCRRATGSAFKPFAGIPRGRLRLVRGGHDLLIYSEMSKNGPHDVHCAHCGSLLWSVVRQGAIPIPLWVCWSTRPRSVRQRIFSPVPSRLARNHRRSAAICGADHIAGTLRENMAVIREPARAPGY